MERVRAECATETERLLTRFMSSASDEASASLVSTLEAASKDAQSRTEAAVAAAVAATEAAAQRWSNDQIEAQAGEASRAHASLASERDAAKAECETLRAQVTQLTTELKVLSTHSATEHSEALAALKARAEGAEQREQESERHALDEAQRLTTEGQRLADEKAAAAVRATVKECVWSHASLDRMLDFKQLHAHALLACMGCLAACPAWCC